MNTLTHEPVLTNEPAYLRDMRTSTIGLDQIQENQLVEQAKSGRKEDLDNLLFHLLSRLVGFARGCVSSCPSCCIEYTDLIQVGSIALLSHLGQVLMHETGEVVPYLLGVAHNAIRDEMRRLRSLVVTPADIQPVFVVSLDEPLGGNEDTPIGDTLEDTTFCVVVNQDTHDHTALHDAIRALSERERQFVVRHFGLYIHAPESLREIARDMGIAGGSSLLVGALTKLCLQLKSAYPHYCSLTRERSRTSRFSTSEKSNTPEQERKLQVAHKRMVEQGIRLSCRNLSREAGVGSHAAEHYLKRLRDEAPPPTQEERLSHALAEMQTQGEKVTLNALARRAHVQKYTAQLYLQMCEERVLQRAS